MLLTLRYGADGADKIALPFLAKAMELGGKMELFTRFEKGDSKMSIARTYTAWSIYSYHRYLGLADLYLVGLVWTDGLLPA